MNTLINDPSCFSDGFTFVKRHQAALIQRLKSVEPVLDHLREQNVLCKFLIALCNPLICSKMSHYMVQMITITVFL